MSKNSDKWANMSAGRPSNAGPPPDSAGSSKSGSSNGKKAKKASQDPNKKQKKEDANYDQIGQTQSDAIQRQLEEKKAKEKIHAQGVANKSSGRSEVMNEPDPGRPVSDVKNADGLVRKEKMEVEESPECPAGSVLTGDKTPGSGGPADETTADAGGQQIEYMDTEAEKANDNESPKDLQNGGDVLDGNQFQQDDPALKTAPAGVKPPQGEVEAIKGRAANLSSKNGNTKSTRDDQKQDTKGTEGDSQLAKPPEHWQTQADARPRDTKYDKRQDNLHRQPLEHYQEQECGTAAGYNDPGPGHGVRITTQKEMQSQRSLQASKQMAYQVFANVLTAIEEQEYREAKKYKLAKPEKSEAFIPDQSWKKDEDVLAGVEAQLTVFQAHMGFCPREVAEAAKVEMIDTTLYWAAARAEIGLPSTPTDRYAINLLEILYDGATSNTFQMLKESRKTFGRAELMENVGKIMAGQAKADHLDKQFRDDPRKEAKALPIRQGQNISDGIERLLTIAIDQGMKKRIRKHLQEHLETISAR